MADALQGQQLGMGNLAGQGLAMTEGKQRIGRTVDHQGRRADPVKADRLAAGVVVQPDAVAEQDRHDVQVNLVDQSQLEQLTADGGGEHLEVLAVGRRQPDPHRLGRRRRSGT